MIRVANNNYRETNAPVLKENKYSYYDSHKSTINKIGRLRDNWIF